MVITIGKNWKLISLWTISSDHTEKRLSMVEFLVQTKSDQLSLKLNIFSFFLRKSTVLNLSLQ